MVFPQRECFRVYCSHLDVTEVHVWFDRSGFGGRLEPWVEKEGTRDREIGHVIWRRIRENGKLESHKHESKSKESSDCRTTVAPPNE
jgi:hypothetical protein